MTFVTRRTVVVHVLGHNAIRLAEVTCHRSMPACMSRCDDSLPLSTLLTANHFAGRRRYVRIPLHGCQPLAPRYEFVKRCMDITLVLLLAPFAILVVAVCSALIWLEEGRPVLFW